MNSHSWRRAVTISLTGTAVVGSVLLGYAVTSGSGADPRSDAPIAAVKTSDSNEAVAANVRTFMQEHSLVVEPVSDSAIAALSTSGDDATTAVVDNFGFGSEVVPASATAQFLTTPKMGVPLDPELKRPEVTPMYVDKPVWVVTFTNVPVFQRKPPGSPEGGSALESGPVDRGTMVAFVDAKTGKVLFANVF